MDQDWLFFVVGKLVMETPCYWKLQDWKISLHCLFLFQSTVINCVCTMDSYSVIHTLWKLPDMTSGGNLNWGYKWRHECGRISFFWKYILPPRKLRSCSLEVTDLSNFLEKVASLSLWNHWPILFIKEYPRYRSKYIFFKHGQILP